MKPTISTVRQAALSVTRGAQPGTRIASIRHGFAATIAILGCMAVTPAAGAADGIWNATTGSPCAWEDASKWLDGIVPGDTPGDLATIQTNILATYVINLNGVRTVGGLTLGDPNSTNNFTLAQGSGGGLVFDSISSDRALLTFTGTGSGGAGANLISAPILLHDTLRVISNHSAASTISGSIGGNFGLEFDNDDGLTPAPPVANRSQFFLAGANTFTGGVMIADVRVQAMSNLAFGTGDVTVLPGGQAWITSTGPVANRFFLAGSGWSEMLGNLGALRLNTGAVLNGDIVLMGTPGDSGGFEADASIFPLSTSGSPVTATLNGAILGGDLMVGSTSSGNGGLTGIETLILNGENHYGDTIVKPVNAPTGGQTIIQVGSNGNTTATLGSGNVYLVGGGGGRFASLRIQRADGFTLEQDVIGMGNFAKTSLLIETTGTGVSLNGHMVSVGEQVRVAAVANGATLNIDQNAVVGAGMIFVGNGTGIGGIVNQSSGFTQVAGEVRVGHYPTETSVWNHRGGTLELTGTPAANPFFTSGVNESTIGKGTLYLGIDGTGIFNHSGGLVAVAAVVLDNRGNTGAGANMPTGIDQYNLTGGTLAITSAWGIQGNPSSQFNLGGGTLEAHADFSIAVPVNVTGPGSRIDCLDQVVTLKAGITGSQALWLGATSDSSLGKVIIETAANTTINTPLAGTGQIEKTGAGTLTLSGTVNTYTGSTTVRSGVLEVASVADGSGSIGTGALTLAGGTLRFAGGSLAATSRTLTVTAAGGILDVPDPAGVLAFVGGTGSITGPLTKTGAGTASLAQPVVGSASVNVDGGTLILNGNCTYTGDTAITNGGNLRLNGTLTSPVSVATGGTLSGTGIAAGLVTIANGGFLSPGDSPGRINLVGGLSLTGTYLAEIASALSRDSINVTGNFTATGIIKVRLLDGFAPSENAVFDLADWTGTAAGAPAFDFSDAALAPGLQWDTARFMIDGTLRVVPEPAVAHLAAILAVGLLARRNRRIG